jgi:hypothetical protein
MPPAHGLETKKNQLKNNIMTPVNFKGQNVIFGEGQPEYQPLPAIKTPDGVVITCWQLTLEELEEVKETGQIYLQQSTFNKPLQPVFLSTGLDKLLY